MDRALEGRPRRFDVGLDAAPALVALDERQGLLQGIEDGFSPQFRGHPPRLLS